MKTVRTLSPNFDARPDGVRPEILVLHYTDTNTLDETLAILLDRAREVSAHYVVAEDGTVHALVDEDKRAWHAGKASWRGFSDVNARSIGIEIQNPGHRCGYRPFPDAQIAAVCELARDICARHKIAPRDVVGHSDVASMRKRDPGEFFPWTKLAAAGVGLNPVDVPASDAREYGPGESGAAIAEAQRDLARIGYGCPQTGMLDDETAAVLVAFQRRWRQTRFDGRLDGQTRALLGAVVAQIFY
ncbi:MAG: N-acetylmuramoyl-L-alanine amidase [Alphaproteobacteria bacterium]|nr:N-acetylmuramoyl-L-alanine amidase [Alphaproteobacteria bacterium]